MELIYKSIELLFAEFELKVNGENIFNQAYDKYIDIKNIPEGNIVCAVKLEGIKELYFLELNVIKTKEYIDTQIISLSNGTMKVTIKDIPIDKFN